MVPFIDSILGREDRVEKVGPFMGDSVPGREEGAEENAVPFMGHSVLGIREGPEENAVPFMWDGIPGRVEGGKVNMRAPWMLVLQSWRVEEKEKAAELRVGGAAYREVGGEAGVRSGGRGVSDGTVQAPPTAGGGIEPRATPAGEQAVMVPGVHSENGS